jgi:hypothetical protein
VVQAGATLGVADGEFDDGVATVVGVEFGHGAGPVGDERVVVPGRKQLALIGAVAHAAHDQPVAAEWGLGDLRDTRVGIGDVDPGGLRDGSDRGADRFGLPHGDREPGVVGAQPGDDLGRPEPRISPEDQLAGGARAVDPPDQLVHEPGRAAGGVGLPGPLAASSTSPVSARVASSGW